MSVASVMVLLFSVVVLNEVVAKVEFWEVLVVVVMLAVWVAVWVPVPVWLAVRLAVLALSFLSELTIHRGPHFLSTQCGPQESKGRHPKRLTKSRSTTPPSSDQEPPMP